MSIVRALSDAADAARLEGRPLPVILTDRKTAELFAAALAAELSCRVADLKGRALPYGVVGMFDGVKIKGVANAKPRIRVPMGRRVLPSTVDREAARKFRKQYLRAFAAGDWAAP